MVEKEITMHEKFSFTLGQNINANQNICEIIVFCPVICVRIILLRGVQSKPMPYQVYNSVKFYNVELVSSHKGSMMIQGITRPV